MKQVRLVFLFFALILSGEAFSELSSPRENGNPESDLRSRYRESQNNKLESFPKKDFSVYWESSFASRKNSLLNQWFFEIPYAEIQAVWPFSKGSQLKTGIDISYKNQEWAYSIDDFLVQHDFFFLIPMSLRAGYFFYPVSWTEDHLKLFSKKTLIGKSLFPHRTRDLGLSLKGELKAPFYYWQISWQSPVNKRETDSSRKLAKNPVLTASFILEKPEQKFFISYFQENSFLGEKTRALGSGADLSYKVGSLTLNFQGEFWSVKRSPPYRSVQAYSLFPSVRWNRLSFGVFFSQAHHRLLKNHSWIWEYILKADVQLTKHLYFTVEPFQERAGILREKGWAFSLRTHFNL